MAIRPIALSSIASDPAVAAFFARGERDNGQEPALSSPPRPTLPGGGTLPFISLAEAAEPVFDRAFESRSELEAA